MSYVSDVLSVVTKQSNASIPTNSLYCLKALYNFAISKEINDTIFKQNLLSKVFMMVSNIH